MASRDSDLIGQSLDDIIKETRKAKREQKGKNRAQIKPGPKRHGNRHREHPYSRADKVSTWKHDKFENGNNGDSQPAPVPTEEERGFKVKVSNSNLTEEEFKTLFENLKFVKVYPDHKTASVFFATKEEAEAAITGYNGKKLDEVNVSEWEYVPFVPKPRRTRPPQHQKRATPSSSTASTGKTGGKIDPRDVVISVKY